MVAILTYMNGVFDFSDRMGTHLGKRLSHKKGVDKGKEDNAATKTSSARQKERLFSKENSPLTHERHELIQKSHLENGKMLHESQVTDEKSYIHNENWMSLNNEPVLRLNLEQNDNSNEVNNKEAADYQSKMNPNTTDKIDLKRDNQRLKDVETGLKFNGSAPDADLAVDDNIDNLCPEAFGTDLNLTDGTDPDADLAFSENVNNYGSIKHISENTHLNGNGNTESFSMKSDSGEQIVGLVDATVENGQDHVDNERPIVEHETNTDSANALQVFSSSAPTADAVASCENNVIYNETINQDVKYIDKMQRVKWDRMKKVKSVSDIDSSSGKKTVDPMLQNLEILLNSMNCDSIDWAKSVLELSKCVRTCIKTLEKETTAILVKNQIAESFLSFLEIIKIELVAKLSNDDIESLTSWTVYKRFLTLFWILCDGSVNFCQYILTSRVFEYLTMELRVLSTLGNSLCDKSLYLLKAILGIFHNICRHIPSSKWVFRNEGLVSVLRIFLSCDIPMVRVKTLIILSYITSETENEIINSDDENFQFIVEVLTDAMNSDSHKSLKYGMTAAEVLKVGVLSNSKMVLHNTSTVSWIFQILCF